MELSMNIPIDTLKQWKTHYVFYPKFTVKASAAGALPLTPQECPGGPLEPQPVRAPPLQILVAPMQLGR